MSDEKVDIEHFEDTKSSSGHDGPKTQVIELRMHSELAAALAKEKPRKFLSSLVSRRLNL
jgi:hypothetical protein